MRSLIRTTAIGISVALAAVVLGAGISLAGPEDLSKHTMQFGSSDDYLNFNDGSAGLIFEFNFMNTDDYVLFESDATTTADQLLVKSDELVLESNSGDVIVRLGVAAQ